MSKYTEELKKLIVLEHKIKHYGARVLQRKYGIPRSLIEQWIAQYELNGKFTEPTRHFSGEFKLKVLNYQQEHHLSDLQTAGTQALFQKQGRYSKMPKKSLIPNKPREEWTKDEELAYLRMENAYLKKYMALVQEDEKKKQKKDRKKSKLSEN